MISNRLRFSEFKISAFTFPAFVMVAKKINFLTFSYPRVTFLVAIYINIQSHNSVLVKRSETENQIQDREVFYLLSADEEKTAVNPLCF